MPAAGLTMISAYECGQNAAHHGKHIQACRFDTGTSEQREWRNRVLRRIDHGISRL
jgi:hypothetical protein